MSLAHFISPVLRDERTRRAVNVLGFCVIAAVGFVPATLSAQTRDPLAAARQQMVTEHVAAEGVRNPRVLESMRTVPRHLFVPPNVRNQAYQDQALPIGFKQTISPPFIVAYMTEIVDPQPTDRVLEIGTGSGYQAAVLSSLVESVYTIEIVEPLGKRAAATLKRLGYDNVHAKVGDGYLGWPEEAPFDKIIVTCSPENVPRPLIEQLKEGGKMIIPIGERYQQAFYLLEKSQGELKHTKLIPTLFVPMTGMMEELRSRQPDGGNPRLINGGFELDENEDGLADGWHYQRRSRLVDDAFTGSRAICLEEDVRGRPTHLLQGLAIDGTQVSRITFGWAMKSENLRQGSDPSEVPGINIYFFDENRLPVGRKVVVQWLTDQVDWRQSSMIVDVPRAAREAIVHVGLNGGTGTLCLDELSIAPVR